MPEYSKANLHGELSYAPITFFGEKLKIGVIGAGRGALIKVRNFYNKGSKIEVLALDFLEDFSYFVAQQIHMEFYFYHQRNISIVNYY